jgi:microsomal dipeptidase-like Zn-dependent dipeptidase
MRDLEIWRAGPVRVIAAIVAILGVVLAGLLLWLPARIDGSANTLDPRTLPEPSERARVLHERLLVVDLHDDLLLWQRDPLARGRIGHTDLPRLREGRIGLQVLGAPTKVPTGLNFERNRADAFDMVTALAVVQRWPVATWGSLRARALYIAARLDDAAERSGGVLRPVRTAADLADVVERFERGEPVVGGLLAAEGMHPLEGEVAGVDALFEAGYRMLAPTHFFDNEIGGSAHGEDKGGLSHLGARAIERMQQLGMLIDLAHASPATVRDVLRIARGPVVVSHVGAQATCPGPRNLSDEQLDAIAAGGGLIGIGFFEGAVCDISPDGIARAARHVADRVGVAHVALGSDWDGGTRVVIDPPHLVHLTDALLRAGFAEAEVEAIMGRNALRLLASALPRR